MRSGTAIRMHTPLAATAFARTYAYTRLAQTERQCQQQHAAQQCVNADQVD